MEEDTTHNFTDDLKIRFVYRNFDYYPYIESSDNIKRIPLLLGQIEFNQAMKGLKDIRGFDLPFETFCLVVTGYLSTVMKYKCPGLSSDGSEFKDPTN